MTNKKIPIERIVNLYDTSIMWADLGPHYNGYQISNTKLIRSLKFFKKYPYGTLIEPDSKGRVYLSNSRNQSEQVSVDELFNSKKQKDFNIPTYSVYTRSRNPLITSESDLMKKKANYDEILKRPSGFHFKIIK